MIPSFGTSVKKSVCHIMSVMTPRLYLCQVIPGEYQCLRNSCLTRATYWSNQFLGWQNHDKVHYVLNMAFVCCLINITELSLFCGARAAAAAAAATLVWHRAPRHPFVTLCWCSVAASHGNNESNVKYHGDTAAKQHCRHPTPTSEFMSPQLDWTTCSLNTAFPTSC